MAKTPFILCRMDDFLQLAGWADAKCTPVTPDWSPRQYWRLTKADGASAILLKGPAAPIAGHGLDDMARLSAHLQAMNLSAPDIYAYDAEAQLMLLEDFGDVAIDAPDIEFDAYEIAVDVLAVFREHPNALNTNLVDYKDGYIYKKLPLFAENVLKNDGQAWMAAWEDVEASLPSCPLVFSHMDYKAGNLHWLRERKSIQRIGLLDYQAAQRAPFVYDIVNLLEDARRDIDPEFKAAMKYRFRDALAPELKPLFDIWYPVIAAQFHARVLGQIIGNSRVSADVAPRLKAYLAKELEAPELAPIKDLLGQHRL